MLRRRCKQLLHLRSKRVRGKNTFEVRDLSLSESPTKTKKFYIILNEQKKKRKNKFGHSSVTPLGEQTKERKRLD